MRHLILVVLIGAALCRPTWSAEIFHRTANAASGGYTWIFIVGKIEVGDDDRFKQELLNLAKNGQKVDAVAIYSPGGSTLTALKIGRYIRTMYLGVWVPTEFEGIRFNVNAEYWTDFLQSRFCIMVDNSGTVSQFKFNRVTKVGNPNCLCASACFFVWAAGAGTHQQGVPEHHVEGTPIAKLSILVHRPYFDPKEYAQWPGETAKKRYEAAEVAVRQYLKEMEVPDRVVQKMFSVASNEVVPLTREEVETIDRRSLWPPYLDEMRIARCRGDQTCEKQLGRETFFERIKELEKMN
jgi:hypothetical protein